MLFPNLKSLLKIKASYWLLVIVAIGFLLRSINLTIGFPILFASGDEAIYHLSALNMLAQRTPFTIGNYGPLGAYFQIPLLALALILMLAFGKIHSFFDAGFLIASHEGYFLFLPRVLSAMFGTLTIIVTYKIAKEIFFKKEIAVFSSMVSAVSFNLVLVSHQARGWSAAIFFVMLGAFFALKAVKIQASFFKYISFAFTCSAVSFGFHQFGGLSVFLIFLIIYYSDLEIKKHLRSLIYSFGLFIFLVLILNSLSLGFGFFNLLSPANKSDAVELIKFNFLEKNYISDLSNFLLRSFLSDPLIFIFFALFSLTKFTKKRICRAFIVFFVCNFIVWILFMPLFMRYMLISFGFLPIFAGYFLCDFMDRFRKRLLIFAVCFFLLVLNSAYFTTVILQNPTYSQLRTWVDSNIHPRTFIVATTHRYPGYIPGKDVLREIRKSDKNYYLTASNFIGENYPENVRNIVYANELAGVGENKFGYTDFAVERFHAEYVIDFYMSSGDRLLDRNRKDYSLVAHFSSTGDKIYDEPIPEALFDTTHIFPYFRLKSPGPYIDVLKVKSY